MAGQDAREQLLQFLDRKAFDPILRAREDRYPGKDRETLEHVKRSTESEKKRYHDDYRTAMNVRDNYLSDLSSSAGKKISKELEDLGLPCLPEMKDEFFELCENLGVTKH